MKNNKKIVAVLSTAAVSSLLALAVQAPAHAADRDFKDITKNKEYKAADYQNNVELKKEILSNLGADDVFSYERDSRQYDFGKLEALIDKEISANPGKTANEITKAVIEAAKTDDSLLIKEETTLKVDSVSAINGTEVTIKLASKPATNLTGKEFTVSDSNGVAYTVTSVAPIDDVTYKLTLDKAVSGKGTLTVNSAKLDFNTVDETFTAKADKTELKADGKDDTTITYTATKNGVVDTSFKGTVKLMSVKGASFAKDVIAFDKGVAKVQITSLSSQSDVDDTIIAIIQDAEDKSFIGKSLDSVSLKYKAVTNPGDEIGIQAVYAQSSDAANVIVKFNKDVNIDTIRKNLDSVKIYRDIKDTIGVTPVDAVLGDDSKTVKFVLLEKDALTDNNTITVKIAQKSGVFYGSEIKFNLVDARAPQAVDVKTPDYRTIVAEFTEAISTTEATKANNWVINGNRLSSGDIEKDATNLDFIKVGKQVDDQALVSTNQIVDYDVAKHIDNRGFVTIRLTADAVKKYYRDGGNLLQASNIVDYAYLSDKTDQNKAQTQEFTFDTPKAPNAPTITSVTMDSPEQFRIKFNENLKDGIALNKSDIMLYYVNNVDKDGKATYAILDVANDIKGNPIAGGLSYNVTVNPKDNKEYIVHLTGDWTVLYDTKDSNINYYTPGYNNVVIGVKKDKVKNFLDVGMENDYNLYANADIAAKATKITMNLDAKEPTATAKQDTNLDGTLKKIVKVTLTEPIQIPGGNQNTPSQQQNGSGVPVPTFQFVSEDMKTTVDVKASAVAYDNMSFDVDASKLTDGKWNLYIRSISDDIGNTSATITCPFEYKTPSVVTNNKPYIVWAKAINDDNNTNDVVKIQYSVDMSVDALRTQYYTINGKSLPEGTNVTAENSSKTGLGTLVTIKLPMTFFNGPENILTVSSTLKDAKGNVLEGENQVKTEYVSSTETTAAAAERVKAVTEVNFNGVDVLDEATSTIDLTKLAPTADKDGKITLGVPTLADAQKALNYSDFNTLDVELQGAISGKMKASEAFSLLNSKDTNGDGKVSMTNLQQIDGLKIIVAGVPFTVKTK